MTAQPPQELSPKEKTKLKTGKCITILKDGTCKCEGYMFEAHVDGFDTCVCGHTQVSHQPPEKNEETK